jgi:Carboxypeptidase regulatory-like domain
MRTLHVAVILSAAIALVGCDQPRSTLSSFMAPTPAAHDLSGTVTSAGGAPIASAMVTFTTGRRSTGVTSANASGFYQVHGLESGTVVVTMSASGYLAETQSVTVTADRVLDVVLEPLSLQGPGAALP